MHGLPQGDALCPSGSVAPAGKGGIPVIQAYKSQSHRSPVYRRPDGFCCLRSKLNRVLKETVYRSGAGYRPLLESEKVLSGTREEGSPSARRVWYEDGRDNHHHGSWRTKTLQIRGGARGRSTG